MPSVKVKDQGHNFQKMAFEGSLTNTSCSVDG